MELLAGQAGDAVDGVPVAEVEVEELVVKDEEEEDLADVAVRALLLLVSWVAVGDADDFVDEDNNEEDDDDEEEGERTFCGGELHA